MIERDGFAVARLAAGLETGARDCEDYSLWLGVTQETDADDTLERVEGDQPDWLVVDHYGLDATWEQRVRRAATRVMSIDDLARPHACDLLVDQNYFGPDTRGRYDGLTPESCTRLLGPRYAIVQPEYRRLRAVLPDRDGFVRRILVYFGGGDRTHAMGRALDAFTGNLAGIAVDVVAGAHHPEFESIAQWVATRHGASLHRGLPTLAGLMARADLAVGAGGTTTWERACLGLPSVVATIARNQEAFSVALARDGYQILLGSTDDVTTELWHATLSQVIAEPRRLAEMARRCHHLTDGQGAGRIAATMLGDGTHRLRLRLPAREDIVDSPPASGATFVAEDSYGVTAGAVSLETTADEALTLVRIHDGPGSLASPRDILEAVITEYGSRRGYLALSGHHTFPSREGLRVTVLSDATSWLNDGIGGWIADWLERRHRVRWVHEPGAILDGDVCFILGCSKLIDRTTRNRHAHNLVVHESALPQGRGWSPMTWQVLEDRREVVVTLFEAVEALDAGPIHLQTTIVLSGTELIDEWRAAQAAATGDLCTRWLDGYPAIALGAVAQSGAPSFYRRRREADSRLDPEATLASQFNLLRVVDNVRYPAYFDYRNRRYRLLIQAHDARGDE